MNHLTASSPISRSESDSDIEVFIIQALVLDISDNQKVFVEKNKTKELLVQQTDGDKLITQQTDTDESVLEDNSTALVQTLSVFKRDLALEGISVRFLIDSGSAINIINLETFNRIKKKNRNLFLKPTKCQKCLFFANERHVSINCRNRYKAVVALFYVIDSNSHNLLTGV